MEWFTMLYYVLYYVILLLDKHSQWYNNKKTTQRSLETKAKVIVNRFNAKSK